MLLFRKLTPSLNVQSDSIRAKLSAWLLRISYNYANCQPQKVFSTVYQQAFSTWKWCQDDTKTLFFLTRVVFLHVLFHFCLSITLYLSGIECQANQASATSEECTVAWGVCNVSTVVFILFYRIKLTWMCKLWLFAVNKAPWHG